MLVEATPLAALDRGREVLLIDALAPKVDEGSLPDQQDAGDDNKVSDGEQSGQEAVRPESEDADSPEGET